MSVLPVIADAIPGALRDRKCWLVWKSIPSPNGGKPMKVPYAATNPKRKIDHTDPAHWVAFDEALSTYEDGVVSGVGFALGDGRAGVDLDDCRDPETGAITPEAQRIIDELNSYTEVSPSGTGVKVFLYMGADPQDPSTWLETETRAGLEVYTGGRYFATTGHHVGGTPTTVERRYDELATLIKREFGSTQKKKADPAPEVIPDGARNDLLFREGCKLRHQGLSESEITATLSAMNQRRCHPPLDDREVEGIAHSASRYDASESQFPLTEVGDAEFFAARQAEGVRYDHRQGRWVVFQGHRWAPPTDGEVHRRALDAIRGRHRIALDAGDKEGMRWALFGEKRQRQINLLALAQNLRPLADSGDRWDLDPWLLGTPSGVVDLRTGQLRDGRPDDRVTLSVSVNYEPDATCPLWSQTIEQIFDGDRELIDYVHRAFGYSLTGDCREECLFLCFGEGANGKGTLMNTAAWVFGDYSDDLPFSALELRDRSSIPNDIAKIVGKRFVTASESNATRLNEARVKAITGRDPITARFLHREYFTFDPMAKFWLATNTKPEVLDDSEGFWRRIHLVPFLQTFVGREDRELKHRLRDEGAGILAWAVRGTLAWLDRGLEPPAAVRDATAEYRGESDPLAEFYEEECVIADQARVQAKVLFRAYQGWCAERRVPDHDRLKLRSFGTTVRKRFRADNGRQVYYVGVGLRDSESEM